MLKDYYRLTKPGIIKGNLLSSIAGFLIASRNGFDWTAFVYMMIGLSFVIGSGCVFNNIIDRDIDRKMERTRKRAVANGVISIKNASIFGTVLLFLGLLILFSLLNPLTSCVAFFGWVFYTIVYTLSKRKTSYATLIGSISGAVPPVVGYTAIANRLDLGALLLFTILVVWQMPHFYAIALFRIEDYKKASIPVLPIVDGIDATKLQIVAYIAAFIIVSLLLTFFGYTGIIYLIIMLVLSSYWLYKGVSGYRKDFLSWSKMMFGVSLLVLSGFCFAVLAEKVLFMVRF